MTANSGAARSLRQYLLTSMLSVAVLSALLFAVPLAWLFAHTLRDDQVVALERESARVITTLPDRAVNAADALPAPVDSDVALAVYSADGTLVTGTGPAMDTSARRVQTAGQVTSLTDGELAVYVSIRPEGGKEEVLRAATPLGEVERRTYTAWAVLLALSLVVILTTALIARRRSRVLAQPFEQLASSARDLGEGAFALRVPHTGIREAEEVGRALEASANRLGDRVRQQHNFAEDVSHQLRTPLTAARLEIEESLSEPGADHSAALLSVLTQFDRMDATINDLLRLPTGPAILASCHAGDTVTEASLRWKSTADRAGRTITTRVEPGLAPARADESAVRQILDVLIENAISHGRGPIEVEARDLAGAVAIDVIDQGEVVPDVRDTLFQRGTSGTDSTGLGLSLASDLADYEGGRLRLTSAGGPTVFTLVLLAEHEEETR